MIPAEHFAAAPNWEWWILGYFVLGGISGGSYAIATLIRIFGAPADQRISRLGYIVSFIALIPCPIFLTLDLGQPLRFWHMLVDTSEGALAFKPWSPMSLGAWALTIYGLFSFVSFLGALAEGGTRALSPFSGFVRGTLGSVWGAIGTVFGLFIASYTGVLLAVSNQTVWSDAGWVLGGLFLASGLTGSAALLLALLHWREAAEAGTAVRLEMADRNFALIEGILVVLFLVSIGIAGTIGKVLGIWIVLWILVALGIIAPFAMSRIDAARRWPPVMAPVLSILGLLALRAVIIFGPQS
jgi:formate-dependent nitrite reductase membrane component NrfD